MKKLFSVLLFFSSSVSFAQGWERTYPLGAAFPYASWNIITTCKASSGGIVSFGMSSPGISGGDFVLIAMKVNDNGDTLWMRTESFPEPSVVFGSYYPYIASMVELNDSSFYIMGMYNYDSLGVYVANDIRWRIDKNGNIMQYSFTFNPSNICDYLMVDGLNNTYFHAGWDNIAGSSYGPYPSVKKYNDAGTLLWKNVHLIADPLISASPQIITQTSDSGVVVQYGYSSSPSFGSPYQMYKLDKNGNLLWEKVRSNEINSVYATNHNTTMHCYGWNYGTGENFYVTEFDSNGDSIGGHQVGFRPLKLAPNQYGGYTVEGYTENPMAAYSMRTFLVAYDSLWNTIWTRFDDNTFLLVSGGSNPLMKLDDGGYLLDGYFSDYAAGIIGKLIRTDSLGYSYKSNLAGKVLEDVDSDCIIDSTETGYKNILIHASGLTDYYTFSHNNGDYYLKTDTGSYSISHTPKSHRAQVCPSSSYAVNVLTSSDTINNLDFFDHLTSPFTDMGVYVAPASCFVPGDTSYLYLYYINNGTNTESGSINFTYDSSLTLVSSSIPPASSSAYALHYNYSGMAEDSMGVVLLAFRVDTAASLGDTLSCSTSITTTLADADTTSNFDQFQALVVSSFDPNKKIVEPAGVSSQGYIAGTETLEYTVWFQNTGNYTAQDIVLRDTISDELDMSTFHLLASSFPCSLSSTGGKTVYFNFLNINLADSTSNEKQSHGFVKYSIKPKTGLLPGTHIRNTASIYFDYNVAVVTNTTLNTIQFPASVEDRSIKIRVNVFPNPFTKSTNFVMEDMPVGEKSLTITDVLGNVVYKEEVKEPTVVFSAEGMSKGIYFYSLRSGVSLLANGKMVLQ